ncbi:MAG: hypothetical protein ACLUHE_03495 [Christensenellales bacterium]
MQNYGSESTQRTHFEFPVFRYESKKKQPLQRAFLRKRAIVMHHLNKTVLGRHLPASRNFCVIFLAHDLAFNRPLCSINVGGLSGSANRLFRLLTGLPV